MPHMGRWGGKDKKLSDSIQLGLLIKMGDVALVVVGVLI